MDDNEMLGDFVEEPREDLSDIEMEPFRIGALGEPMNDGLVDSVVRAIHSVKDAAGFLGLTQINDVAHRLENVLGKIRDHQFVLDPYNVDILLKAANRLRRLIECIATSNEADDSELIVKLDALLADATAFSPKDGIAANKAASSTATPKSDSPETATETPAANAPAPKAASTRRLSRKKTPSDSTSEDPTVRVAVTLDEIDARLCQERTVSSSVDVS